MGNFVPMTDIHRFPAKVNAGRSFLAAQHWGQNEIKVSSLNPVIQKQHITKDSVSFVCEDNNMVTFLTFKVVVYTD